jgi:eukaryotic-like serine/threonine-protein kinase
VTNSDPSGEDPTLTSNSLAESGEDQIDLARADLVAERVLSESEPLPFRDRFPMGGTIGKGGMAEVYMARDRVLNRVVAVKVMHAAAESEGENEGKLRRFLREAQITAQLSHPNVVPVHAMENNGLGRPAFVMKCVQGQTLKEYIESCSRVHGSPLHDPEVHGLPARLEPLQKVCDAISFAHSRGVLHLDLKPANIMIGAFGEVYVMDWGIAKVVGEAAQQAGTGQPVATVEDTSGLVTGTGGMMGTPIYMPPEQLAERASETSVASDQFALGMILYELLTLHVPRRFEELEELIPIVSSGQRLPFGSELGEPSVPAALQAVVERATAPDPESRYESVEAMAADLRRFLRNEELSVWPDNLVRRSWRSIQRHPVRALIGVMLVLVTAALVAISSLVHALGASERHQEQTEILSTIVSKVSAYVNARDRGALQLETLVESLAVEVEACLRGASRQRVAFPVPGDLMGVRKPADTATHERYRQPISYLGPVIVKAPGTDPATAEPQVRLLGRMPDVFQSVFLRAIEGENAGSSPAEIASMLRARSQLGYAYVGLDSGVLLSFPANALFPSDYDPRERPWYRQAPTGTRIKWGDPYADASGSGYLVPCNRRVRGPDGKVVGVVGIDAPLDRVIEVLRVPDLPHQRRTLLLDSDARVVARDTDLGRSLGVGTHADRGKSRSNLGIPALARKIRAGRQNGVCLEGNAVFVFARLSSLRWYVVVELDAERTLDGG